MARLTQERLAEIGLGRAERALDLDGLMAAVSAEPLWELHPLGLRLIDRDAVREFYRLHFEYLTPHFVNFPHHVTERVRIYGDDCLMMESMIRVDLDGRESECYNAIMITCNDRYITSERAYVSGALVTLLDRVFGGEFRKLPGVVEI